MGRNRRVVQTSRHQTIDILLFWYKMQYNDQEHYHSSDDDEQVKRGHDHRKQSRYAPQGAPTSSERDYRIDWHVGDTVL